MFYFVPNFYATGKMGALKIFSKALECSTSNISIGTNKTEVFLRQKNELNILFLKWDTIVYADLE